MDSLPQADSMETFKQRVLDKIKGDIGSLLPDEAISELVNTAVHESFFAPTIAPKPGRSTYSNETIAKPSWFAKEVMRQAEPLLQAAVQRCIEQHRPEIDAAIAAAVDRDKLLMVSAAVIGDSVRAGMVGAALEMLALLKSNGIIRAY